jgi:hypothetical protein
MGQVDDKLETLGKNLAASTDGLASIEEQRLLLNLEECGHRNASEGTATCML